MVVWLSGEICGYLSGSVAAVVVWECNVFVLCGISVGGVSAGGDGTRVCHRGLSPCCVIAVMALRSLLWMLRKRSGGSCVWLRFSHGHRSKMVQRIHSVVSKQPRPWKWLREGRALSSLVRTLGGYRALWTRWYVVIKSRNWA